MKKGLLILKKLTAWKLIALIAASGCASYGHDRQVSADHDLQAARIIASLSSTIAHTDTLSAVAQIDLATAQGVYPLKAVVIVRKPSYLRLELLPVFGTPDFFLISTPNEIKILLPTEGKFYQGSASGRNLARFIPWEFDMEELVAIFVSGIPPLRENAVCRAKDDGSKGVKVEIKTPPGIFHAVRVDAKSRLMELVRFDQSGKELYKANFEDYFEGSPLAGKITVSMADGVTSLAVKYSEIQIEKTADLSVFELQAPAGFKTIFLD